MRKYWWLLILPALLLLWWALDRRDATVTVHFANVQRGRIESTVPTNGKVDPAQWAAARAEVAGVVRAIDVQRGQPVRAGDVLVRLDTTAAEADLASALARRQEAQAELLTLGQGGKASQLANLDSSLSAARSALDVAQRNYDAEERLANQQAATKLAVQEARDALERAKQVLASVKSQRQTLVTGSDKMVAQAKLKDADAAVALAQRRVSLGSVRAPLTGTVYKFDLKVGAYLQPGELVGLVGDIDRVKIAVYIDEPDLGRISPGLPVVITWDARPGRKWLGKVDKLPTEVAALDTRKVGEVDTIVDNPDHELLPGVTINATIVSRVLDGVTVIPKAALRNIAGKSGTFVLRDKQLAWTPVESGVSDINNIQVLSGLRLGEKVADRVVEPADAEITNGLRVRVAPD